MNEFRKMIEADFKNIFLNPRELGEMHNLNGSYCLASIQALTDKDRIVQQNIGYEGISGEVLNVFCVAKDLDEQPGQGEIFKLDDKIYYVQEIINNFGMLKITLGVNKP